MARHLTLAGHVQGVGFRPFVFRLAHRLGLAGRVWNSSGTVEIEVQGPQSAITAFESALIARAPPLARPRLVGNEPLPPWPAPAGFSIEPSAASGPAQVFVPPDQFACNDCLAELADPADRRHRYPFINCTQCGPRYTLIERLPYDRPNTSMARFTLCADCQREYQNPFDRRYHAEPTACSDCGPRLRLRTAKPAVPLEAPLGDAALADSVRRLRAGEIVAVKGIGGYHLLCDACNEAAVARLRKRKHRPDKPLAVMYPRRGADDLDRLRQDADLQPLEVSALRDPARAIVLVRKRPITSDRPSASVPLAVGVSPGLNEIGALLPYSPLHELLLEDFGGPLVATSGNISGEPVITDSEMAEDKLASVADAFLHHDRPIVRPADDSVLRRSAGAMRPLRLGRGLAPLELELAVPLSGPLLATGAHLKNCLALAWDRRVVISPHIGSMDSARSLGVFEQVATDLQALYGVTASRVVCDAHPGLATSRWARRSGLPVTRVWHHHAHASALVAEYGLVASPVLVFCWDGLGLGEDGTLWGGEVLHGQPGAWRRVGSLRAFRLPGGDRAALQPWRSALSLCLHTGTPWADAPVDTHLLREAWERGVQSPWTSSAGRLFDAAAALVLGIRDSSHEAQAPMQLEALAEARGEPQHGGASGGAGADGASGATGEEPIPLEWHRDDADLPRLDWAPLLPMLMDERRPAAERAARFHESLAAAVAGFARQFQRDTPAGIGLTGGVFQNRRLVESCVERLAPLGAPLLIPRQLPANDAAICFGQVIESCARDQRSRHDGTNPC